MKVIEAIKGNEYVFPQILGPWQQSGSDVVPKGHGMRKSDGPDHHGECGKKFTLSVSLSKVKVMKGKCCYSGLCNRERELSTCELMWTRISSMRRNARSNALHASLKNVVRYDTMYARILEKLIRIEENGGEDSANDY